MSELRFRVNDRYYNIPENSPQLDLTLLSFLREEGFTGVKKVCNEGGCGACTVVISRWDHESTKISHSSVATCLTPLASVDNTQITTIEGLKLLTDSEMHPVCEAFYKFGASQCGFCTPGFIMTLVGRLNQQKAPKKQELENIFDGNLCRCTGYRSILDASSVFCENPVKSLLENEEANQWREDYAKCKGLDDLFPDSFKCSKKSKSLIGARTTWLQPIGQQEVVDQLRGENKKQSPEEVKVISGNTDVGYWESRVPSHFKKRIYINRVKEIGEITRKEGFISIGAAVPIAKLTEFLEKIEGEESKLLTSVKALLNQCRFFANQQVRNMATVGGGLMNFSTYSDLIPVWVATGCSIRYISNEQESEALLLDLYEGGTLNLKLLNIDLLLSIELPLSEMSEVIESYKYARRRTDSIAFLSACLSMKKNESNKNVEKAIICFDGLGTPGFRAVATEEYLCGKQLDSATLKKAFTILEREVNDNNTTPYPQDLKDYQVRLAKGILLRFSARYNQRGGKTISDIDQHLTNRYPKVVHRSQISYAEKTVGVLGEAIPHRNAKQQVTGEAKYACDKEEKNTLFGVLLTSPVAYGKIKKIDPSVALREPGIVGFFSAKDIPGKNKFGFRVEDEEVLASEYVEYVGQPLGILVGTSEELIKEFVKTIVIEIDEKEAILTFDQAIEKKSFHGKKEGYLLRQGSLEEAFDGSFSTISGKVDVHGQSHFYLEPQSAMVVPSDDGYRVYSSTQSPSDVVDHISRLLNVSNNKVDVSVGRIGGGFGGKQLRAGPIAAICSLAAAKTARPVKLTLQRAQDMQYCPGRSPVIAHYKAGFDEGGKFKALKIKFYLNGGCSSDYSADITETATLLMDSCYRVENIEVHGLCLKMNYGSYTSTRGFGKPQASAVIETILDHGASVLGLDPTEVRTANLYQKGDKTITRTKIEDSVISECWNRLLDTTNYSSLLKEIDDFNRGNKWLKRGVAVVGCKGNMGFLESNDINRGLAVIQIHRDGTISLNHSGCEMGQGINTRMAQVAAYNLQRPLSTIEVTDTRSDIIPHTPPTTMVATDLIGKAIITACQQLNSQLGKYEGAFGEKVKQAYEAGETLSAKGVYTAPHLKYDYDKQMGDISYFFVWGTALSVVEVDMLSGSFRLIKTKIIQDCGKSLNPHLDIGQAEGGFMFGVGYYTMESPIYSKEGRLISNNVASYKIPSSGDVPLDWDIELLNYKPEGESLHSSKGIGESNTQLGLSAYFAIKDAVRRGRVDHKLTPVFNLGFPASVEKVSASLPILEDMI